MQYQNVWRVRNELLAGEPELHLLPVLCTPDRLMVDVGANVGIYTHIARRYAGRILAIEPQPRLAAALRAAYGSSSVEIVSCGLSDRPGTFSLYVPVFNSRRVDTRASLLPGLNNSVEETVKVDVRTLDSFELRDVGLIKIDVEGLEMEVLRGARETLTRCRPSVIVEAEERMRAGTVAEVADFMGSLGYNGFFIWRNALQPLATFEAARHQTPGTHVAVGDRQSDDYINNFIYMPADAQDLHARVTIASRLARSKH